jgi:putative Mg2+ transporter-C (MgtC) family protein
MELLASAWQTIVAEFSDLGGVPEITRVALRLLLAAAFGAVLGFERERKGKAAGMRTHMLVCLGASLFVLVPDQAGADEAAISRVIQGLVAGIGFLGAGAIIKRRGDNAGGGEDADDVKGLTTAAGIFLTAAIGVAVGLGREATALLATVLALVVLHLMPKVARDDPRDDDVIR